MTTTPEEIERLIERLREAQAGIDSRECGFVGAWPQGWTPDLYGKAAAALRARADTPASLAPRAEAGSWLPTAENINALPEPIRRYIHDLETNADPAGMVLENHQLRQQASAVEAMYLASRPQASVEEVALPQALADIAAERRRQIEVHNWTADHDDAYTHGEIATAAADYALPGQFPQTHSWAYGSKVVDKEPRRRQLVKAAALIVAEIERLDRALTASPSAGEGNHA